MSLMNTMKAAMSKARMLVACVALAGGSAACDNDTAPAGGGLLGGGNRSCCSGGNCVCHGGTPTIWNASRGPFGVRDFRVGNGRIFYPSNAQPPFAGVSVCGGFLNTGGEMRGWGNFYASYGIVTHITRTGAFDFPAARGRKLGNAVRTMKQENNRLGSPLNGKMANRYATSGYSMGGGGTTRASRADPSLKASVGLASWSPIGLGVRVPTLFLCGSIDIIAGCGGSRSAYNAMSLGTPKMLVRSAGAGHLVWFGPRGAANSGKYALAWLKTYLEGDTRWKRYLQQSASAVRQRSL